MEDQDEYDNEREDFYGSSNPYSTQLDSTILKGNNYDFGEQDLLENLEEKEADKEV